VSDRVPSNSSPASANRAFGLGWACVALTGSVLLAWLIVAPLTTHLSGHSTWEVGALAAGICWAGATVSLVLLHLLRLRGSPMTGALLGMLVRMTIPLAIGAVATTQGGSLAGAGLFGQLVAFYLITLAIETCLSVALMKSSPQVGATRSAVSDGSATHG
jgi:hypothetical protein